MRKAVDVLLLVFCYIFLSSCGGDEEKDSTISIEAIPDIAYVLPGSDYSCLDRELRKIDSTFSGRSVAEYRIRFANFKLTWAREGKKLNALFLRLEYNHDNFGGDQFKVIDSDELDVILGVRDGEVGYIPPEGEAIITESNPSPVNGVDQPRPSGYDDCALKYGGIAIEDVKESTSTSATLVFRGIAANNDDSDPRSVRASFRVQLRYEY